MRLAVVGCPAELRAGLDAVRAEFPPRFGRGRGAREVVFERLEARNRRSLAVSKEGRRAVVRYRKSVHAFRALGRLLGESGPSLARPFSETAQFDTLGLTVDVSRNAVLAPSAFRSILCRAALMGINAVLPYLEDTFEMKNEPFFGYLRGRYTFEELKSLDDFAFDLGIEMFPCIETLSHLEQVLQWPAYAPCRGTGRTLLAGEGRTYALLGKMIRAASAPFRSRRIHVGLAEAMDLAEGTHRQRHGPAAPARVFLRHLKKVHGICARLGLRPMMWSDMFFRLGSKNHKYYDPRSAIPAEWLAEVPKDMQICYWDLYHTDPAFCAEWIDRHRAFGIETMVDGAIWTWDRLWAALPHSLAVADALLTAAKAKGVREVLWNIWGDDGAECNLFSSLPAVQHFAEHGYRERVDDALLRANFRGSCDADFDDFMAAAGLDAVPGAPDPREAPVNVAKPLLWEDPLLPVFSPVLGGVSLRRHYERLARRLARAAGRGGGHAPLRFAALLARALSLKSDLPHDLRAAYASRNKTALRRIARRVLPALRRAVDGLWRRHRDSWMRTNKPFGWEVIERRYGGLKARLETLSARLGAYLAGDVESLPELEEKVFAVYDSLAADALTHIPHRRVATPSRIK